MITIIHGDDLKTSRDYFLAEKQKNNESILFDKELTISELIQFTDGGLLFEQPKNIFIENFFAGKKTNSAEFKEIVGFLEQKSLKFNFFLWEGKALEKGHLSTFKNSVQKVFNLPQSLFSFLDGIKPNNLENVKIFHEALTNSNEDILFYMLIRQFRLLLAVLNPATNSIDEVKRLAPWQKSKLEKQAKLFSNDNLLKAYADLLEIDLGQKSGTLGQSLTQSIDIFLSKI